MAETTTLYEKVDMTGDIPVPRFGHTITSISKHKSILFGGATGDVGKYSMTGDTYMLNTLKRCWIKLNCQGIVPSPRAAHASAAIESMQMVVYGGATGGTSLRSSIINFRRKLGVG